MKKASRPWWSRGLLVRGYASSVRFVGSPAKVLGLPLLRALALPALLLAVQRLAARGKIGRDAAALAVAAERDRHLLSGILRRNGFNEFARRADELVLDVCDHIACANARAVRRAIGNHASHPYAVYVLVVGRLDPEARRPIACAHVARGLTRIAPRRLVGTRRSPARSIPFADELVARRLLNANHPSARSQLLANQHAPIADLDHASADPHAIPFLRTLPQPVHVAQIDRHPMPAVGLQEHDQVLAVRTADGNALGFHDFPGHLAA